MQIPKRPLLALPHAVRAGVLPLLLAAGVAQAFSAQVVTAVGEWSDEFDRPGLVGRVFALGTWNDKLYAGGLKLASDGEMDLGHFAEFDGQRWRKMGGGIASDVRDFAVYEGDLVVAGWFSYAGDPAVPVGGVARWDGTSWSSFGAGLDHTYAFDPEIWAVEVYQGELYAGGRFDSADGKPIASIARWDGTTWQPVGGGLGAQPITDTVLDMHVTGDGKLVVAGEFQTAGGAPARNIAVWDGTSWSALGDGLGTGSSVFAIEEFGGKLYATGNFLTSGSTFVQKIAAWNGSSWEPVGGGLPDWDISATGYSLEAYGDALYVGGNFVEAGTVASSRVARWTGSEWQSLGGVAGSDLATTAIAMTIWDGKLVVGGEFTVAGTDLYPGNGIASESVVAFDGSEWSPVGDGLGFDGGARVLLEWKGELLAAGGFKTAGLTNSIGMASFDGAGWEQTAYVWEGTVHDALIFEGDLVVTGDFGTIDGKSISGTARLDAVTGQWQAMLGGGGEALAVYDDELYALGLGSLRRWNGSSFQTVGTPIFGQGYDLHAHGGKLYVAGNLGPAGPGSANLMSWDGTSLEVVAGGTDRTVHVMTSYGGNLVIGGEFNTAGGTPAKRLASFDGAAFHPFGSGQLFTGFAVTALYEFLGDLWIGGDLVLYASPYDWVAKWNGAQAQFEALPTGGPLNEALSSPAFCFYGDEATGELYVGGGFTQSGGMPAHGLARFDTTPGDSFVDVGGAVAGSTGTPKLAGTGDMAAGATVVLTTSSAPPGAPALVAIGFAELSLPLFGGSFVPMPAILLDGHTVEADGTLRLEIAWPSDVPPGFEFWAQTWLLDAGASFGAAASNGLHCTAE